MEKRVGLVLLNGHAPGLWYRTQNREEMRRRGDHLRTLRQILACLITDHARLPLMRRAATGEDGWASYGENSTARHVSLVEDGHYWPLWEGTEADWRAEMCNPITWLLCRTICRRHPRDYEPGSHKWSSKWNTTEGRRSGEHGRQPTSPRPK